MWHRTSETKMIVLFFGGAAIIIGTIFFFIFYFNRKCPQCDKAWGGVVIKKSHTQKKMVYDSFKGDYVPENFCLSCKNRYMFSKTITQYKCKYCGNAWADTLEEKRRMEKDEL